MDQKFRSKIEKYQAVLKQTEMRFQLVGYGKLLFLILLGVLIYLVFSDRLSNHDLIFAMPLLVILITLWIYHLKLDSKVQYLAAIIAINQQHIDRINGEWISFSDNGSEFVDSTHPYANDLDVVGEQSLFQFLNTTKSWYGRQSFAHDLLMSRYTATEIFSRQQCILELSEYTDLSNQLQYHFSQIGCDENIKKVVAQMQKKELFIHSRCLKLMLKIMPLFTCTTLALSYLFNIKWLSFLALSLLLSQAVIWIVGAFKLRTYLAPFAYLPEKLNAYLNVINIVNHTCFKAEKLILLQQQLSLATQAIKELEMISDKIGVRNHALLSFVLNLFLLWDYECALLIGAWQENYADQVEDWFVSLGEFESILCLSYLPALCPTTTLPSISEQNKIWEATAIGHPLLPHQLMITNDFSCHDHIFIITGSNMSGKTTFLRTVGINLVLAQAGSFVCASQMTFRPIKLMTSMRIADDLNAGISTFYAELKRIKLILDTACEDDQVFFLIDEIFRGTNSVDRIAGANAVISKLNKLKTCGLISTHDLELCHAADQSSRIENYSFSEYYQDDRILFDYKIKSGKSVTTNAQFLMKLLGLE